MPISSSDEDNVAPLPLDPQTDCGKVGQQVTGTEGTEDRKKSRSFFKRFIGMFQKKNHRDESNDKQKNSLKDKFRKDYCLQPVTTDNWRSLIEVEFFYTDKVITKMSQKDFENSKTWESFCFEVLCYHIYIYIDMYYVILIYVVLF